MNNDKKLEEIMKAIRHYAMNLEKSNETYLWLQNTIKRILES